MSKSPTWNMSTDVAESRDCAIDEWLCCMAALRISLQWASLPSVDLQTEHDSCYLPWHCVYRIMFVHRDESCRSLGIFSQAVLSFPCNSKKNPHELLDTSVDSHVGPILNGQAACTGIFSAQTPAVLHVPSTV